jgi:hypothetical protein
MNLYQPNPYFLLWILKILTKWVSESKLLNNRKTALGHPYVEGPIEVI